MCLCLSVFTSSYGELLLSASGKLLLVFASTFIIGLEPRETHEHFFQSIEDYRHSWSFGRVNCWWPSPAQLFSVSGLVETHAHIFVFTKTFLCFVMGHPLWELMHFWQITGLFGSIGKARENQQIYTHVNKNYLRTFSNFKCNKVYGVYCDIL